MSKVAGAPLAEPSAPRWTPPMPPVANTRMPAAWAAIIVAATVVAPQPPDAIAAPRLGRDTLRTDPWGAVASASSPSAPSPTRSRPSLSATVAGTAPVERIARLGGGRDLHVLRVREAVADERGLEGDDGRTRREGVGDLGGDGETVGGDHALRVRRVIHAAHSAHRGSRAGVASLHARWTARATRRAPTRRRSASRWSSKSTTSRRTGRSPSSPGARSRATTTWRTAGSCRSTAGSRAS